ASMAWTPLRAREGVLERDPREHGALHARRELRNARQSGRIAEGLLVERSLAARAQGVAEAGDQVGGLRAGDAALFLHERGEHRGGGLRDRAAVAFPRHV